MEILGARLCQLIVASFFAQRMIFAGFLGAPQPVTVLGKRADVVALATATAVTVNQSSSTATVQLSIIGTIKGQPGATNLEASVALAAGLRAVAPITIDVKALQSAIVGSRGIWFLRLDSSGYQVIPLSTGRYSSEDLFLRQDSQVPASQALASFPPGNVNQVLLAYLVRWYQALPNPGLFEDSRLLASFQRGKKGMSDVDTNDLLSAARELIKSGGQQHIMGLVLALQLGSDSALSEVLAELDSLKTSPKFVHLTSTIATYPLDGAAIPLLLRETAMQTDAPGLDAAVASALTRLMGNRDVVPGLAKLLDSKDEVAQVRAARFFSVFSLLSDAHGNVIEGAPDGPLATAETRRFSPGADPTATTAQCVQFWKAWWTENAAELGFSAQ